MLKNTDNKIVKKMSISFDALLKLKEAYYCAERDYEKANDEFPGSNRTITLQDKSNFAYMAFLSAARIYYGNDALGFESLLKMLEEEENYIKGEQVTDKRSTDFVYKPVINNSYYDSEDNWDDELNEQEDILIIKKGN